MSNKSDPATARREEARHADGEFGEHVRSDPEAFLVQPMTVSATLEAARTALGKAREHVPVAWLFRMSSRSDQARVREAFRDAHAELAALDGLEHLPYTDKVLIADVANIAVGTDPRGGTFHDQAVAVGARLSDYLHTRDQLIEAQYVDINQERRDALRTVCEEAGYGGILPGMLEAVAERDEDSDEVWAALGKLDPADLEAAYEDFVGPSVDRLYDFVFTAND